MVNPYDAKAIRKIVETGGATPYELIEIALSYMRCPTDVPKKDKIRILEALGMI